MKQKRSLIQEQQPDHEIMKRQNEINLQPAIQVYRMYKQLHTPAQAEQVADSLGTIEFLQKQCEKNMKLSEFTRYAAQFFRYEYYKFGYPVMNQGEYGDRFYILLQGEVGVYIKRPIEEIEQEQQYKQQNEGLLKKKKTLRLSTMSTLGQNEMVLKMQGENSMYYKDGIIQFKRVFQYYSGQCFGDQALIHDQPRSASIIVVSEDAHLISMNKHDYKQVCDKQIQEQNATIDYFMKLFPGTGKFTISKFIQNFRLIQFPSQALLWKEGEEPKFFFLILHGRIELFRHIPEENITLQPSKKKKKIILSQLSDNAFVGQDEIIDGTPYRLNSCQVADNTIAYYMEAIEFNNLRKNFPDIVKMLKEKSQVISQYMNNRQINIINNLQEHENAHLDSPVIVERKTVKEIFKDPSDRPDKNDIRSYKPKLLLQTEIANCNLQYNQKKLPTDLKTQFLMIDNNMMDQVRDRVSRQITTAAEKKERIKTTKLEGDKILISRIQSAVSHKRKKLLRFDTPDVTLKITSSETLLISSPTVCSTSSKNIPIISRAWNPQSRQLKAKLRQKSYTASRNTAKTGFSEYDENWFAQFLLK